MIAFSRKCEVARYKSFREHPTPTRLGYFLPASMVHFNVHNEIQKGRSVLRFELVTMINPAEMRSQSHSLADFLVSGPKMETLNWKCPPQRCLLPPCPSCFYHKRF